ncbi:MAG: hypothetical protein IJ227_00070, partial [Mogibacterium sp.]|nr:hypothetical protein [Mogibacterium sp.]
NTAYKAYESLIPALERLLYLLADICRRNIAMPAAAVVVLILLMTANLAQSSTAAPLKDLRSDAYAASSSKDAGVYVIGVPLDEESGEPAEGGEVKAAEIKRIIRGTPVTILPETEEVDGVLYIKTDEGGAQLSDYASAYEKAARGRTYIRADQVAMSLSDVVRETEVFVRTPVTVYAEAKGPSIASFAPKGSCLSVLGYDILKKDGSVHKYKVGYKDADGNDAAGFVYGKYVTDTQEKADAVYNDNGIADKVKKDKYGSKLYGGKAENLDYYPYERTAIEGKEFCADARAMYLNCAAAVNCKNYIKIINDTGCNAVVADIKDGVLAYKSDVAKELSPRSYKTAYVTKEEYKKGIDALRETGVYLIGRIVVFNDPIYAKDHPEDCIKYRGSTVWPSAYSRNVWEYNVRLAQEAVKEFGFDEIQFDYVRFPESSYDMSRSGKADFRNAYDEEKGQAIQNFCFYAADQIHEAGAYFSVDVFGESVYGYMTAYGQYWPGISNIVDAISAMPYTDHMGAENSWETPYATTKNWAKKAKKRQDYLEHPAAARTWITGYDTPYWAPTVTYGKKQMKSQAKALKDAGLEGGFIPWNAASDIGKYRQYKAVWNE